MPNGGQIINQIIVMKLMCFSQNPATEKLSL